MKDRHHGELSGDNEVSRKLRHLTDSLPGLCTSTSFNVYSRWYTGGHLLDRHHQGQRPMSVPISHTKCAYLSHLEGWASLIHSAQLRVLEIATTLRRLFRVLDLYSADWFSDTIRIRHQS